MALELEDSQPFLNTLEPSHDSATCRANLEVAIENDSAAEVVKLSNYQLPRGTFLESLALPGIAVVLGSVQQLRREETYKSF